MLYCSLFITTRLNYHCKLKILNAACWCQQPWRSFCFIALSEPYANFKFCSQQSTGILSNPAFLSEKLRRDYATMVVYSCFKINIFWNVQFNSWNFNTSIVIVEVKCPYWNCKKTDLTRNNVHSWTEMKTVQAKNK